MSYDRIWIQRSEHPGGWLERTVAERNSLGDEFNCLFDRLYAQGHSVVLVAGDNYCFDELFLFEIATAAQEFYDRGFHDWESFIKDDDEGCGFEEVSLYRGGHMVVTKSWAFPKGTEVQH